MNLKAPSFLLGAALAISLSVSFLGVRPVNAGPACDGLKGDCLSNDTCELRKLDNPEVTSQVADCVDPLDTDTTDDVCCITPGGMKSEAACSGNGGSCMAKCGPNDDNIGTVDCAIGKTCCKTKTQAPKSGGSSGGGATPPLQIVPADVYNRCFKGTDLCTPDDIVKTGVGFANFLMGLSGALFLIIFIYGGALYLLSFGNKEWVGKGQKAIKGAVIGLIIVLGAWTIVSQVVKAVMGTTGGGGAGGGGAPGAACTALGQGYTCQTLTGATAAEVDASASTAGLTCRTGLCPGDFHTRCCTTK